MQTSGVAFQYSQQAQPKTYIDRFNRTFCEEVLKQYLLAHLQYLRLLKCLLDGTYGPLVTLALAGPMCSRYQRDTCPFVSPVETIAMRLARCFNADPAMLEVNRRSC